MSRVFETRCCNGTPLLRSARLFIFKSNILIQNSLGCDFYTMIEIFTLRSKFRDPRILKIGELLARRYTEI